MSPAQARHAIEVLDSLRDYPYATPMHLRPDRGDIVNHYLSLSVGRDGTYSEAAETAKAEWLSTYARKCLGSEVA